MAENQDKYLQGPQQRAGHNWRFSSLAISILIAALLIDSVLSDVSTFFNRSLVESARIVTFSTIIVIAVLSGSRAIVQYTRKLKIELGFKSNVVLLMSRAIPFIQYTIIGILILITLQIILTSQYLTSLYVASLGLSWSTGVILMGIMSFKFIQWYRVKRNLLVLLYFISSLMFCTTLGSTIVPQLLITVHTSPILVNSHSSEIKPFQANPEKLNVFFAIISVANWLIIPLSLVVWAASAAMLSRYAKKFGRTKYWIMLSAPLASLLLGDISLIVFLPFVNTIFDQQVIFYTMMAFGGMLAEGFLLAFAFITISKSIESETRSKIRDYLWISAIGVVILFVSFFANPSAGSYLPFGILSASFFAFGVYLFFAGIYSSAIAISFDQDMRHRIRTSLLDKSELLDSIGLADINRDLEKQTEALLEEHEETMKLETGFERSISKSEMKNYVEEVKTELQRIGVKTVSEKYK
jgi:hypothetical protein